MPTSCGATNPDTGERQRIEAWKPEALHDPVGRNLELPNGAWTLSLAPTRGWVQRSGLLIEGLVGVVFSALLAYLAWLLYAMRLRDLELEVAGGRSARAKFWLRSATWRRRSTPSLT
jgi:hypothetical protein